MQLTHFYVKTNGNNQLDHESTSMVRGTVMKVMDEDVEGGAGEGSDLKFCLFS